MPPKLKVTPSPRWTPRKKLNFELKVKTVSYFRIVYYNLRCLQIKDIVDFKDKTWVDYLQELELQSWVEQEQA